MKWLFVLFGIFIFQVILSGQRFVFFNGEFNRYYNFDLSDCRKRPIEGAGEKTDIYHGNIGSFHPDGYLYILHHDPEILFRVQVLKDKYDIIADESVIDVKPEKRFVLPGMAISEQGRVFVQYRGYIMDLDTRSGTINEIIEERGPETNEYQIFGFYKDRLLLADSGNDYRLWDWRNDNNESYYFEPLDEGGIGHTPAIYYPACGEQLFVGAWNVDNRVRYQIVDHQRGEYRERCDETIPSYSGGRNILHPTMFRRSSLRIDLDGDNSSKHITAGYYDTLTTCPRALKQVPITDKDVELYTCEEKVDSISFRLKYFDNPRLEEELLEFPGAVKQTSPSRWVWTNHYGDDENKIKEFMSNIRYSARWESGSVKERVVITTMHVGSDSTSSWSVIELLLEPDAGRDTIARYCSQNTSFDLTDFLDENIDRKTGYFIPTLTGGGSIFDPSVDKDGEYKYILKYGNCADTSIIKVEFRDNSDEIEFPGFLPDSIDLCAADRASWQPAGWDSVVIEGNTYLHDQKVSLEVVGNYEVNAFYRGCSQKSELEVISSLPSGETFSNTFPWCSGSPLTISLPDDNVQNNIQYKWIDGHHGREREVSQYGQFPFSVRSGGCYVEAVYSIEPGDDCPQCTITIPNAVSPNGDGVNDRLDVFTAGCVRFVSIILFDKWGNTVYQSDRPVIGASIWDKLASGTYIVKVSAIDKNGNTVSKTGSVFVVR